MIPDKRNLKFTFLIPDKIKISNCSYLILKNNQINELQKYILKIIKLFKCLIILSLLIYKNDISEYISRN